MKEYRRNCDFNKLLNLNSFFLFGPRATGKSYWIDKTLNDIPVFDLLDSDVYERFLRRPAQLREEIPKNVTKVVIDEIQKLPKLLDEVHYLISKRGLRFLLTGSSARKLKRSKDVNLLAGRSWETHFFPLSWSEIDDFLLLSYLNRGGLPRSYLSDHYKMELKSYCQLYLKEEIKAEGLTRNIGNFTRFLDVMALNNGQELHYTNISNDTGVPIKTVENYIQVLEDTLLGFSLLPFRFTKKRKAISRSKFYFFDIGVANQLAHAGIIEEGGKLFGDAFGHFLILEARSYLGHMQSDLPLQYWRSQNGQEVDLVIGYKWAIEIKATTQVNPKHLKGLKALKEEGLIENFALISRDPIEREIDGIQLCHWEVFLKKLWNGQLA